MSTINIIRQIYSNDFSSAFDPATNFTKFISLVGDVTWTDNSGTGKFTCPRAVSSWGAWKYTGTMPSSYSVEFKVASYTVPYVYFNCYTHISTDNSGYFEFYNVLNSTKFSLYCPSPYLYITGEDFRALTPEDVIKIETISVNNIIYFYVYFNGTLYMSTSLDVTTNSTMLTGAFGFGAFTTTDTEEQTWEIDDIYVNQIVQAPKLVLPSRRTSEIIFKSVLEGR